MIHPHTQLGFVNEEIGYGLFATQLIPKGTITWILDDLDLKLEKSYIDSLEEILKERVIAYSFRDTAFIDSQDRYIICWDAGQFMNHSSEANCVPTPYEFTLASKDIYPGEELTDDYRWFDVNYSFDYSSKDGTIGKVKADDIFDCYQDLERQAEEAFRYFNRVEQPLKSLVKQKYLDKLNAIAEGKEPMDSLIECYQKNSKKFSRATN
ncbi:SET domain-containing protein [Pleurocapsa sp. PCC 7327]|uniref:SET domain-containing protein n=1 Tax=Pleurocapsa sp. PCC 7327 TaxID=118163 RepID=UPI00029FCFB0|nr:SET domain-containing protein [Pleurocapsa sp. PCC 7327]AFY76447.1 SET domain-containing protein [Pleurocapsa sp. PCC 7327]